MIRSTSFRTEIEMTRWMNAQGLDIADIYVLWMNASNFWTVFYEDGIGRDIIDTTDGPAGTAYGTVTGVGTGGATVRVHALRVVVASEAAGTPDFASGSLSGTVSHTYVIPDSFSLSDPGGTGFSVKDDGFGFLLNAETGNQVGVIDYSNGNFTVKWPFGKVPMSAVNAAYSYSSMPDTDNVPVRARLSALSLKMLSGTAATVAWAVYNDSAKAHPPTATGTITLSGSVGSANLFMSISNILDLATRDSRWVELVPNTGTNNFEVLLTWERIL
jgi:hypothetical protein